MNGKPLTGIRVLDLTRFMAGPYAAQLLALLGADVIKVEPPGGGDPVRALSKFYQNGMAAHFVAGNANKRSFSLDLRQSRGREIFLELLRSADVLLENFRPGTLERLGLDEGTLRAANPDLIIGSVTGFGKDGPWSQLPSYDLIAQAAGGSMYLTGVRDQPPVKMGIPVGDLAAGLMLALAAVAGLCGRRPGERGETIDISMMDVQLSMLNYHAHFFFASGQEPEREGAGHPNIVPYGTFDAADGQIAVAVYGDRFWSGFCRALERPELIENERFATNAGRLAHRKELVDLLEPVFRAEPRQEWRSRLAAAGVPAAPVFTVGEALTSDQAEAREMVVTVPGPDGQPMQLLGSPIKLASGTAEPAAPPPVGNATDELLGELGYDAAALRELHESGIV